MEGNFFAAPRLASDFFANFDCWASDPHQDYEGQAFSSAEIKLPQPASAPIDGQVGVLYEADFKLLYNGDGASASKQAPFEGGLAQTVQASLLAAAGFNSPTILASDPQPKGQAFSDADFNLQNSKIRASDPKPTGQANPQQEGKPSAVNSDLPISTAHRGKINVDLQDTPLLQKRMILSKMAYNPIDGYAIAASERKVALPLSSAASLATTTPLAAHPKASSTALPFSSSTISAVSLRLATSTALAIPTLIPIHEATPHPRRSVEVLPTSSLPIPASHDASSFPPAIPVLTSPAATPRSQWHDEVSKTSSVPLISIPCTSPLRAQASPWTPRRHTLPSLLIGDIPLSLATTPTPKSTYPSTNAPPLAVGFKPSCKVCGHHPHVSCGPSSSLTFPSSRLRGSNVADQAQESKAAVHHHGTDPARRSTRPRCKMKSELKGFRMHKATLDPG